MFNISSPLARQCHGDGTGGDVGVLNDAREAADPSRSC